MPVGTSGAALAAFSGAIRIDTFTLFTDDAAAADNLVETVFPNVDLQFVSDGGDLIPLERGILVGSNSSVSRRYAHANVYNTTPMIRAAATLGPMCPP
jgi:hypothetical protein